MYQHIDADEWEHYSHSTPCTACDGHRKPCLPGRCNGSCGSGMRRRAPEEVARIKAERRGAEENEILARAAEIQARRAMETPHDP